MFIYHLTRQNTDINFSSHTISSSQWFSTLTTHQHYQGDNPIIMDFKKSPCGGCSLDQSKKNLWGGRWDKAPFIIFLSDANMQARLKPWAGFSARKITKTYLETVCLVRVTLTILVLDSFGQIQENFTEQRLLRTEIPSSNTNEGNMQVFVYLYLKYFCQEILYMCLLWLGRCFLKPNTRAPHLNRIFTELNWLKK